MYIFIYFWMKILKLWGIAIAIAIGTKNGKNNYNKNKKY